MNKIEAMIQPDKLEDVKDALLRVGIIGMIITDAQGFGRPKGQMLLFRGVKYTTQFLHKIKIETVVSDEMTDRAVDAIVQTARKGYIGEGEVLVLPVGRIVLIRGEEQNQVAHLVPSSVG
jgi:nitrogen regulatory protein P-II 1